ncbi:hypothetical protein D3C80_96920 [compost metagenome]
MGAKILQRVTAMVMQVNHQCPHCQQVNKTDEDDYNPTDRPQGLGAGVPFHFDCQGCGQPYEFIVGYHWQPDSQS